MVMPNLYLVDVFKKKCFRAKWKLKFILITHQLLKRLIYNIDYSSGLGNFMMETYIWLSCQNENFEGVAQTIQLYLLIQWIEIFLSLFIGVIEYLSSGRVSTSHIDFREIAYKDCLSKLGNTTNSNNSNEFTHPFQITRAYNDGIMPFTNYS